MHFTISGILISMKYDRNSAKGFFILGSDHKDTDQEFDRKTGGM